MPQPDPDDVEGIAMDPRKAELLPVSQLRCDRDVQRPLDESRIVSLSENWDWSKAEAPTVVPIGKHTYRVDEGQHRVEGLRMYDPHAYIWCIILDSRDANPPHEAEIALAISTTRKRHDAFDTWTLRLRAGDPYLIAATKAMRDIGLSIARNKDVNTIQAVQTIDRLIRAGGCAPDVGSERLVRTLTILMRAWPDNDEISRTNRFDRRLVYAVGELIRRNPVVDDHRMIDKLSAKAAHRWWTDVADRAQQTQALVDSIQISYNRGMRTGKLLW